MLLIPAIDLKDGQCVQLRQGAMASASIYSDDPPGMAQHWQDAGALRLHVVDLDGAFAGEPRHAEQVAAIIAAVPDLPVQIGGGIRSAEVASAYLIAGASQVVVGTRALEDVGFLRALIRRFPGQVILGVDAHEGRIATRGWTTGSDTDALAFAAGLRGLDLFAIVYTDIARDGMLSGVNAEATKQMAQAAQAPVIASGGIRNLDDLRALKALGLPSRRLLGAISGSALYEHTLDFEAGQRLLDEG